LSGAPEEFSAGAVSKLENHVIVLGYKLLGIYLVEKLKEMGLPCVVVVRDESELPALHKSHIPARASPIAKSFETLKAARTPSRPLSSSCSTRASAESPWWSRRSW
jgi:hypothetical protein